MNENKTKLELFRKEIEKCAEKEAALLMETAEKEAQSKLSALEKELEAKRSGDILKLTEDFRSKERKRVSEVCFSEGRRVLLHRNKLVENFFAEIEKKLYDCVETAEYDKYLSTCVKKAESIASLENAVVLCREKDTNSVNKALSAVNCSLEADNSIKIGGIIVKYPSTGVLIDLTLDSAIEEEKEKFSSLKEMQL